MVFANFIRQNKNLFGKAIISGLQNTKFGKVINKTISDWSSGQYHLPGYNYCGSGTQLNGQKSINNTDEACKKHDYAYNDIKRNKNNIDNLNERVRNADKDLINEIKNESGLGSMVVRNVMKLKNLGEDFGVIKHDLFI